jgi:hypothetical protein
MMITCGDCLLTLANTSNQAELFKESISEHVWYANILVAGHYPRASFVDQLGIKNPKF